MTGWLFGYGADGRCTEAEVRARPAHVPFIVGFGGGVDSTSMLVALHLRGIRPDAILFADTRGEKRETYAFLPRVDAWLHRIGFPQITIVVNESPVRGDVSLEARCLRNRTLPSRAFGMSSCSFAWKIEPQEKWVRAWEPAQRCWAHDEKVIKALGYDAGEERRATVHEDDRYRYWYPLQEWSIEREECVRYIEREGLPRPPKSACFFCPSSKVEEVVWLHDTHPDLFARAVEMERTAQEAGELGTVRGLGRHWSWQEVIAMTLEQRAKLPMPAPGCIVCQDGECEVAA